LTFEFKTKPYDHQLKIFQRSCDSEYFAFFMEQGTGKTKVAIDTTVKAYLDHKISAAVVVAKKGVYGNWYYEELPKHCSIAYRAYLWRGFYYADERKQFTDVISRGHLAWFICNVDALTSPKFQKVLSKFLETHKAFMLIGDETTSIKNPKSARTKEALKLAPKSHMRRILSGLPNPQSPLDLFSQCQFLKPGVLGHSSFSSFKARYAILKQVTYGNRTFWAPNGYRDLDDLSSRIKRFASIVKKEDCLDLPPKIYRTMRVELTDQQRLAYDELRTKAVTYIQEHEITAINALSLITRLLQICCGQLKLGEGSYASIPNNRIQALLDLVDEASGKVVVWTHYVRTAQDLMVHLKDRAVLLPGGLAPDKRQERINLFKTGEPQVLIANPASSGHGISLVESSTVIYYSNSYNLEHRMQSEDRTHRIGQTKSCLYVDLVSPDTIEPLVIQALKDKKHLSEQVINSKTLMEFLNEMPILPK
jgi:SNF2 family DNA or RNA helicase